MTTPLQPVDDNNNAGRAPLSPPASPILSRHDENRAPEPTPATTEPPKKRRKVDSEALVNQSDEEVWHLTDEEIIDSLRSKWHSSAYDHYIPSLVRDEKTTPRCIRVILTCKFNNPSHQPFERLREARGSFNTTNMASSTKTCVKKDPSRAVVTLISPSGNVPYSEAMHRTLIALRCASSKRAFNQVEDPWYLKEVEMLRPGTKVPSADTVANDVQRLYQLLSVKVKDYFANRGREIHAVADGWTSPIEEQYLGAGIVWEDSGEIHYIILEFIRLTEKHTGDYLAREFSTTLKKYGLDFLLHLLQMDNAGNCNTTATCLPKYIPTFRGVLARGRCFLHIIQLVAKMIISFFFKQPKRKTTVKAKKGSAKRSISVPSTAEADDVEEIVVIADDLHEPEDNALPTAQELHDTRVVNTLRDIAIRKMGETGVKISAAEEKDALKLFPKVAGLAKKVHESRPIHTEFATIIANPATGLSTDSNTTELARRNATRWGSEYNCLRTRRLLQPAVDVLLADKTLKLSLYAYNKRQERLSVELETVLELLQAPSKVFQGKNRPLIVEVIPEMEDLDFSLNEIVNARDMSNVTRVAAFAGLLVLRKYYALLDECEAYRIAIVLCPDRKLQWFRDRMWTDEQIADLRSLVVRRFTESYKTPSPPTAPPPSASTSASTTAASTGRLSDRFRRTSAPSSTSTSEADNIHTYLDSPLVEVTGTVIQYWTKRLAPSDPKIMATPQLARFALSFCSCPATSVDAERSFSEGRHQIAWNQQQMSSQAFRAQMALASWAKAPFFDLETTVAEFGAEIRSLR
ncbi:putative AC transposase [Mycena sanguinolenta]|uniref:Putative AC transposase n=1 Tax=Mycena sanguinolenta TaxID=230812 RepID=A0A8H6XIA5_9AGAR|nr:putative AC transposase [Mycena sanguinolenta]